MHYKNNYLYQQLKRIYHLGSFPFYYFTQNNYKKNMCKWFIDNPANELNYEYDLNSDSVVFDLGGHIGLFSEKIIEKFDCYVYIFEPVKEYVDILKNKFSKNKKVKIFDFWLSSTSKKEDIYVVGSLGEWTSIYQKSDNKITIDLIDIEEFLDKEKIDKIDLFSINIEWGEYDVIPRLIETWYIKIIQNIQIQFHDFIDQADQKRKNILGKLNKTHKIKYSYPFVWEAFTLNKNR